MQTQAEAQVSNATVRLGSLSTSSARFAFPFTSRLLVSDVSLANPTPAGFPACAVSSMAYRNVHESGAPSAQRQSSAEERSAWSNVDEPIRRPRTIMSLSLPESSSVIGDMEFGLKPQRVYFWFKRSSRSYLSKCWRQIPFSIKLIDSDVNQPGLFLHHRCLSTEVSFFSSNRCLWWASIGPVQNANSRTPSTRNTICKMQNEGGQDDGERNTTPNPVTKEPTYSVCPVQWPWRESRSAYSVPRLLLWGMYVCTYVLVCTVQYPCWHYIA